MNQEKKVIDESTLQRDNNFSWAKAFVLAILIISISTLTGVWLFLDQFSTALDSSIKLETVSDNFVSFVSGLESLKHLQVARLNTQQEYFLTSEKKLFKYLPAGTVEVAAKVPCEITYVVDLQKSTWKFILADSGRRLHVIAPQISFNKPAVNLSKFKLEVIKYSYIRDNEEVKQLLQAQIPEKLEEVAQQNIDSIRDTARLSIKDFIENWLIASFKSKNAILPVVDRVYFADERHLYQNIIVNDRVEAVITKD
jgi:hypothetical protein